MKRCLICYQPMEESTGNYHKTCCRSVFDRIEPPELPYCLDELDRLAEQVIYSHVTVPGVQAKLSLHLDHRQPNAPRFTLVGLWGNFILKPPVPQYPQMPEIEDLTMHLAEFFKIDVVPHALIPLKSGELAYITKRIDRTYDQAKIHMEDMCQLTGRMTENKYRGSMEQIGKVILKWSSNPLLDVLRFFEVTLFSFLTGNADMHLKNYSLMYQSNGMIQLSPAYDLLSTRLLIPEEKDAEELALTLNGKKLNLKHSDFTEFAQILGLNEKQIENVWRRFQKGYPEAIKFVDDSLISDDLKPVYQHLLAERADRLNIKH
ncbi:HipA domain-containing protein [bacterium]|nr:HipA domain-containing protein [bacterium]